MIRNGPPDWFKRQVGAGSSSIGSAFINGIFLINCCESPENHCTIVQPDRLRHFLGRTIVSGDGAGMAPVDSDLTFRVRGRPAEMRLRS
jgi:hypothetical protein